MQSSVLRLALAALLGLPTASSVPVQEPVSRYLIDLRADPAGLAVRGQADFPPMERSGRAFAFSLTPLVDRPDFSLRCAGRDVPIVDARHEEDGGDWKWTLTTREDCPAGSPFSLHFAYRFSAGAAKPQLRIGDGWGFAGGGGELWYPQRNFAERQLAQVTIDVPAGTAVIASGVASGPTESGGRVTFRFTMSRPAKLAFAYGPYAISDSRRPPPVRVMTLVANGASSVTSARLAPLMAALSGAFGPPPFDQLSLVEVDFQSRVLGTSEYGMIFADPSKMRGAFDAPYWAHEFGHQWWGLSVRGVSGSPGATLLTEGMAQYGALVAIERAEGAAAAAEYRRAGAGGSPSGSLALYRNLLRAGRDRAIADFQPAGQQETILAHNLATTKGAIVLRYFSSLAGEARVHRLLRQFLDRHRGGRTTWAELEDWLDRGTRGEFHWFFPQWLHRAGAPAVSVRYCLRRSRAWGEVSQSLPEFRLPLTLALQGRRSSVRRTVNAHGPVTRFDLRSPGTVERLILDPDALVPTASIDTQRSCAA